ncbi:pullulanase-associated domain-containing protein [Treponema socranskii]
MKNMLLKFGAVVLFVSAVFFAGCAGSPDDGNKIAQAVEPGTIGQPPESLFAASKLAQEIDPADSKVILFYYRPDGTYADWGLWLWKEGGEGGPGYEATKGKAVSRTIDGKTVAYWDISTLTSSLTDIQNVIATKDKLNFIVRKADWTKDVDGDRFMSLTDGKHFMVINKDPSVYSVKPTFDPSLVSAATEDVNIVKNYDYKSSSDRSNNFADTLYIKAGGNLDPSKKWFISHPKFKPSAGLEVGMTAATKAQYGDYEYPGTDLGLTLNGSTASFKTWAPLASDVTLLLFNNSNPLETPAHIQPMTKDGNGIWSVSDVNVASYRYYKFRITNGGVSNDVCDIYAKVAGADSVAAQIADINSDTSAIPSGAHYGTKENYKNPFGKDGTETKSYTDAVIYEMHIRDWAKAENAANKGKYLEIANGTEVIAHLKDLGVTHVQLLPVFDYAEKNSNTDYNWGYNPYHYNVPEGRYVSAGYTDGTQAVLELRTLINKLHEAGIAVIMDVVYNHTSGTGTDSLYDMTAPYYYYNMAADGTYVNGSGCGNEIDTAAPMSKKYIIESLKHWMLDYHMNGFRFDLMGCIEKSTMKEIYRELSAIDKNVMVYGEPWTGGTSGVKNGITAGTKGSIDECADKTYSNNGVACFDDDFRNAVKGAEFGGFKLGHVQGTFADSAVIKGLLGSKQDVDVIGRFINYVECHDNYTLFDKLAISRSYTTPPKAPVDLFAKIGAAGLADVKKQDMLAAAYVFLAQGTPFINGGQEFLRTKKGDENSYNKPDAINAIDLGFKTTYSDVYNTYKGLIALRKGNHDAFGANSSATAQTLKAGLTKYATKDFLVYFNATGDKQSINHEGYTKLIDVSSGSVTESPTIPSEVAAKSFIILKK